MRPGREQRGEEEEQGWAGSLTVAAPAVRAQLEAGAAGTAEGARGVHTAMGTPGTALCTLIHVCKHTESRSAGY